MRTIRNHHRFFAPARPTLLTGLCWLLSAAILAAGGPVAAQTLVATGSYVGDGAGTHLVTGVGFQPDLVIIKGDLNQPTYFRTATMANNSAKSLGSAASATSNRIRSFLADGFELGHEIEVNELGETYYWIALKADPLDMAFGVYGGDATDDRPITGVGFAPDVVLVASEGAYAAEHRTSPMPAGQSGPFTANPLTPDRIQDLLADGFEIGTDAAVNENGAQFHWVAWQGGGDLLTVGTFLGDGSDDRDITGLSSAPRFVTVKTDAAQAGVHRPDSIVAGDLSLPFDATAGINDGIQALLADGFQVGTDPRVNAAGNDAYWIAFAGTSPVADLALDMTVDDPAPAVADTVWFTLETTNGGPDDATGIEIDALLPAGLTFLSASVTTGSYNDVTGLWQLGNQATTVADTLIVAAVVDAGTEGTVLTYTATVTQLNQTDPDPANDTTSAQVTVQLAPPEADLALGMSVDDPLTAVADTVTFTLATVNLGPDDATGIVIDAALPVGLSFVSASATVGSYDDVTGLWQLGDLTSGTGGALTVIVTVDAGTEGMVLIFNAAVTQLDQTDPNPANDTTNAQVTVQLAPLEADLALDMTVDEPVPAVADTVWFTLETTNGGPDDATGIEIDAALPAGLTFLSASVTIGSYDDITGLWQLGNQATGVADTLIVAAMVDAGTEGTDLTYNAAVAQLDQTDPNPANDTTSAQVTVYLPLADLALGMSVDDPLTAVADTVTFNLATGNNGPDDATGIVIDAPLSAGLTFVSASATVGSYDDVTGLWQLGDLTAGMGGGLTVIVTVDPGTEGTLLTYNAVVTQLDQTDPNPGNDSTSAGVTVLWPPEIHAWAVPGSVVDAFPGAPLETLLAVVLTNSGEIADTVTSVTVTNTNVGPGTQDQRDAEWQPLELFVIDGGTLVPPGMQPPHTPAPASFSASQLTFANLAVNVDPGDTVTIVVQGAAALVVRDAALLTVNLADATALELAQTTPLADGWPLAGGHGLLVDGMVAAQIGIDPVAGGVLPVGSLRNPLLICDIPANGFLDDTLLKLNIVNHGDAIPGRDIGRMEAWSDDGDGAFDEDLDVVLGEFVYTGDRWELTGLDVAITPPGLRLFVTVDVADTAQPLGNALRLGLPSLPDPGIGMLSGNDGPIDQPVDNPNTHGLSVIDRVIVTSEWISSGTVYPGTSGLELLHLALTNTYTDAKQLTSLSVTNITAGDASATQADLDGTVAQLFLRWDGDGDGQLDDIATDPLLASGAFFAGRATFTGLTSTLPPGEQVHLFVTADISLLGTAEGDEIAATVTEQPDVEVPGATVIASWPLDSNARWDIDGMIAAQISEQPVPVLTLAPDDGPFLALDVTVPANGYLTDVFGGINLINQGNAAPADIAALGLWRDGGDGIFTGDIGGDDVALGPFTWLDGVWHSASLSEPIPLAGLRLFTGLTVSASPTDSATIRLVVPIDGVTTFSGNSGPLDQPVPGSGTLVLSTAPLLSTVAFAADSTTVGQSVTVTMSVRNAGGETVLALTPNLAIASGEGSGNIGAPTPASVDLAPDAQTEFSWSFTTTVAGALNLVGNAEGTGETSGLPRQSHATVTLIHRIFTPVDHLDLYPVANLPFSINRGQEGVVPLTLTFHNPGDSLVADALMTAVRLRLDESVDGPGIVPAELLSRITVLEGADIYADMTDLPTSGATIDLTFDRPARVTGSEPVTLNIRCDIRSDAPAPSFLVSIIDSTWITAEDAVNGDPVPLILGEGQFPVQSAQATLVSEASGLAVAVTASDTTRAGQLQTDVTLLELVLMNTSSDPMSSSVALGSFSVRLHDAAGTPVTVPEAYLSRLAVHTTSQVHYDGQVTAAADSSITLNLSPPVNIAVGAQVTLTLAVDLQPDAPLGPCHLSLGDTDDFDARDANTGTRLSVTYQTAPDGGVVVIEARAMTLLADGDPGLDAYLPVGSRDVTVLHLDLTHPGPLGIGGVVCDSLRLRLRDAARRPLAPALYLDLVRVMDGDIAIGTVVAPADLDGAVTVPLTGFTLTALETTTLAVVIDLKESAPTGSFEALIDVTGIYARDLNLGTPVAISPAVPGALPVSSGVTTLIVPSETLLVDFTSQMPPVLAAQSDPFAAAEIALSNPADSDGGDIIVAELRVRSPADGSSQILGAVVSEVWAVRDGEIWAQITGLAPTDSVASLVPSEPLAIVAGGTVDLTIELVVRQNATAGALRVGVGAADIAAAQPISGIPVAVEAVPGKTLPLWSEAGNLASADLAASYANFPNPFAAGREVTTFVYSLRTGAEVSLRLLTPYGETVATLLEGVSRSAGLHQDDTWTGHNGNGVAVRNGVYLAELVVRFDDGEQQRVIRKVAVVR